MKKVQFHFSNRSSLLKKRSVHFIFCLLVMLSSAIETRSQIVWVTAIGQAWLVGGNWAGGLVPNTTDIAQFGTTPTSGVTGIGINMANPTNNGLSNQAVGAIEVLAIRPVGVYVGNSSLTNGTLTLNGATVNATNNVILRNNCASPFDLVNAQGFNVTQTMILALNNNTNNIINLDAAGGITISCVISGAGKNLTLAGAGNATLALTAANTYTGLSTVSSNTMRLNNAGGGTLPSTNNILINGGALRVSSNQTISDLTMTAGAIVVDAGVTLTIIGAYNVTGGAINNQGTIKLNGAAISFPGTGVTINNGFAGMMTRLEIASTGDITQTAPFTVDNELVLSSGILISTAANHITCSPGCLVTGVSNTSFIDGPVSRMGTATFIFPVGKRNCGPSGTVKGFAPLEISNFTGAGANELFTAEYKRGDALALGLPGMPVGLDHISRCDYWILTRDMGTAKVDIRLYWNEPINNCTTAAPYINYLPSLTVVHNDNLGGAWDFYIAGLALGLPGSGNVVWSGIQSASFGAFTIGSVDFMNPLPITVNYFNGIKQNSDHLLKWKVTCTSTPTATMVLERSVDGRNYNGIYSVTATALQCQQPFNYTDNQPAEGVSYYRLKMTGANGKTTYSTVVSLINAAKGFQLQNIAPNPVVNGNLNLNISSAQKTSIDIIISDMQGRIMQKQTVAMIAGFNSINMNVKGLAKGTYQLYANSAAERTGMLRFVIQ